MIQTIPNQGCMTSIDAAYHRNEVPCPVLLFFECFVVRFLRFASVTHKFTADSSFVRES